MEHHLSDRVAKLMQNNRRTAGAYTYTVPSPEHYPFQWFWDSCFHAIILSHFDAKMAQDELRALLAKPLANGLIPHMIYWDESYRTLKWGREYEGDVLSEAWGTSGVSSITQPPLVAVALWHLHERTGDIAFLNEVYPALRTHYLALIVERSFSAHGLMGIINPDESGEDNSPRFDELQDLPSRHTPIENFRKRVERVREYAACNFDAQRCMVKRFWVEDVTFNTICLSGFEALSKIASEIGEKEESKIFEGIARQLRTSMHLYMKSGYRYFSLMGEEQEPIHVETWSIFMPLYAGLLHKDEATMLIEKHLLNRDTFYTDFPVPSVSMREPSFTKDDLWRGPTWAATNWFIFKGLKRYGYDDLAHLLRRKTEKLIAGSGFREYYDARTGEGYGAHDFTWGGLVIDMQ